MNGDVVGCWGGGDMLCFWGGWGVVVFVVVDGVFGLCGFGLGFGVGVFWFGWGVCLCGGGCVGGIFIWVILVVFLVLGWCVWWVLVGLIGLVWLGGCCFCCLIFLVCCVYWGKLAWGCVGLFLWVGGGVVGFGVIVVVGFLRWYLYEVGWEGVFGGDMFWGWFLCVWCVVWLFVFVIG
uniref:Uncharacterized protein n=1 Tax=Knipowitschia caucasica TaxID=637954 RepID=A0AAV2L9Y4_KNICA